MNKEYPPLTVSEVSHYVEIAKKLPRDEAETIQRALYMRAVESGCTSPEIFGLIQSISDRFVDEDKQMRREAIDRELRSSGLIRQEYIEIDDDQIVVVIRKTLPKFQNDWDWGGIYRILVDFCDFPAEKADFVRRFARMGIYPDDNIIKIERSMPPSIRGDEWHGHPFTYQSLQKGVPSSWPKHYNNWMKSDIKTRNFIARREIASTFLANLRDAKIR